jgi:anaerobic selenocysteine-containing dehydrogenase
MINLVLANGWEDSAFCARFTRSLDYLRASVADFSLDYAAERTGLAADAILAATRTFATARRKVAASGTGANMCERSNLVEHLVECLNAICGNYRRAGGSDRRHRCHLQYGLGRRICGPTAPRLGTRTQTAQRRYR